MAGILFDFFTQSPDGNVYRPVFRLNLLIAPKSPHEFLAGIAAPGIFGKQEHELEFLFGAGNRISVFQNFLVIFIQREFAPNNLFLLPDFPGIARQMNLDPRQQLLDGKGLADVIVGPCAQGRRAGLLPRFSHS